MTSVPAFRPTALAAAVAFALHAPWLHASTFEGEVVADSVTLTSAAPASSVYGDSNTAGDWLSLFEGHAASGFSRVSATSDGSLNAASVQSTLIYRQSVTNPFATAQNVGFNFYIPNSRVYIPLGDGTNLQTVTAVATFFGNISWGGSTAWSMSYGVTGSGNAPANTVSQTAIGPALSPSASGFVINALEGGLYVNDGFEDDMPVTGLAGYIQVRSDPYSGYLDLGVIAGNATVELTYTLIASASFEATYRDSSASSSYGYGGYAQAGGFDPFGIEFTPDPNSGGIQIEFTQAVPEPSTYAMLLGGLLAVGAVTARRRRALMGQADAG